jgi:DNA-binding transcriptional regulator/RsmH inhibitor MraZ
VLGIDAIGRITLPPEARAVAAGRRTVRAASHECALVLRAEGLGAPTHLDRRGRLALPTWLRGMATATGTVLVAARFPDASVVVVTPTCVLDALIKGVAGEVD